MGDPSSLGNPLGKRGSACVEVIATLHGSTPSPWKRAKGCVPPEVRVYDSTKREVMGTLVIDLQIGPTTFSTLFQVLRIPTSFNLLLGQPWIHKARVIPSSLHQKVKFIHDGQVITQGSSEFIAAIDHDTTFGLGFIPTEADYRYMARLRKERVMAQAIDSLVHTDRDIELQHLFHQLQLSDGAPGTSVSVAIAPLSSDRASLLSLCFSEEVTDDGVVVDPTEMIDGVVPHDEASTTEVAEETQTIPAPELLEDDGSLFEGTIGRVEGASDLMDPLISFDVLSGFVSRSDDVSIASFMDLNDEIVQLDSDRDYFDHDSDSIDVRASPTTRDVETIDFGTEDQPRELKIGSPLSKDERYGLNHLLRSYLDVFAWSYEDIPGLDPSIVQHHLPVLPHARLVKQKLRRLHPQWLANVIPVPKKDDKVRVCVDFKDLNKASTKDDFPLPHIDLLVDSTAGHSMLSFMDGFSRVMPFGLKNVGATYQRTATTLFHDMMHRDVEDPKFRLGLNPKKYTFGVTSRKLLRHMVSEQGIEVDPDKIKAILGMPMPRIEKEIRVPPMLGRPLLFYLSASDMALRCMLAQLDDLGNERVIYYLSKRILEYEMRCYDGAPFLDKEFVAMTSLSGWCMYFDGATNQLGYGIGVLLVSPQGDHIPRFVRLAFSDQHLAMNNIVEYEACILGLKTALELGIRQMEVFDRASIDQVMREVHAGVCGLHMEGHILARKIMRTVAIDYFTKWVEAASYARLTSVRVVSFIRSHIIYRYGVPHSDRGVHFQAEITFKPTRERWLMSSGRVKPRPLQKGDLVLRILRGMVGDPRGKFRPSWSGPYVIGELTPEEAAWLTDLDGKPVF
ncbi:hypothetical protein CK203_114957 [Vitis vinifera]|uniref:RNase H type-1 domain-containing protein n=1 Tax=Vitis vinifera TaxID=29760 RepID=A0A438CAU9_VITVI|nr:hypothetical protein CK203_114957 [Vitis vinifera]